MGSGGVRDARVRRGTAKDVLSRLRHGPGEPPWESVRVTLRHRGAPGNERTVDGPRITGLGTSFFEVDGETSIPYHRVQRIEAGGRLRYERPSSSPKSS